MLSSEMDHFLIKMLNRGIKRDVVKERQSLSAPASLDS